MDTDSHFLLENGYQTTEKTHENYYKINIDNIITDSRTFTISDNSLFFAIIGKRHDGHNYIKDLYKKNVRNFVISKEIRQFENFPEANFIIVPNCVNALQKLAKYHRQQFDIPVVGITGSNGKTIIKDWLSQLLENKIYTLKSPKSYNSQIGVPISVLELNSKYKFAIFEAGISQINEMHKLQQIIEPDLGIITNIGDAHQENFTDIAVKIIEKLKLFKNSKKLFYCKDYLKIDKIISETYNYGEKQIYSWSKKHKTDLFIKKINKNNRKTEIEALFKKQNIKIQIPFVDNASIENSIHILLFLLVQFPDIPISEFNFSKLLPVEMRLEQKQGKNNCTIINDSYNCDFASLRIALDFLNQQNQNKKKTLILSDIQEVGKEQNALYQEIANIIQKNNLNNFIGIGKNISQNKKVFKPYNNFFISTDEFIKNITKLNFENETILLKGARDFKFENIAKVLQEKNHRTIFEINLQAIINNLNYFRSLLKPETKIMVMVKAFAYGSGTYEVANILQHQRVDYLGVAYTDEGIALRKAGINIPIMVMNPDTDNFNNLIEYNLEPEIYNFQILNNFYNCIKNKINSNFPIHLKLETGMNRLGFEKNEIPELILLLKKYKKLHLKSIFSHLAGSPSQKFDNFTQNQISKFQNFTKIIKQEFDYKINSHILNSAGIERFPEHQFDMVRLGIGLYGISATKNNNHLQNIGTLKSKISQIKEIKPTETIGYDRNGKITKKSTIAVVPIGYADGLNRRLSNGKGKILVKNKYFAPIIGNICMDMCMIDITDVPARIGDEVIIFGEKYPITEIAEQLETIPYEILTSVSQRVKRIYII